MLSAIAVTDWSVPNAAILFARELPIVIVEGNFLKMVEEGNLAHLQLLLCRSVLE